MRKLWQALCAPYCRMPGRSVACAAALSEHERLLTERLQSHVKMLSHVIGERNESSPENLTGAGRYIERQLRATERGDVRLETIGVSSPRGNVDADNIILELPGNGPHSDQIFVIGAHYDTVFGSPGANDNASGIAALIEIAHILARAPLSTTLRMVAFCNEEHVGMPPNTMGSFHYAAGCKRREENIIGMWSLETIGFFSNTPGSQNYPPPFDRLYPTVGNFLAFVSNYQSRQWLRQTIGHFRDVANLPSEGVAAPAKFADIGRSDQWGFWQAGYPALMITDTANFRYPWYHSSGDTYDKVDYESLARVTRALAHTAQQICRARS